MAIAKRLGVSDLATGLIMLIATSMPEMVASLEAALVGSPVLHGVILLVQPNNMHCLFLV